MSNIFKKLFSRAGKTKDNLGVQTLLAPMAVFDKERVKNIVRRWLFSIESRETLPQGIVALNFNVWEAVGENGASCYTLELTGSKQYDAQNDDWACEEDFEPNERNCDALQLSSEIPWEEVLKDMVGVLKELKEEQADISLFRVEHVTVGFSDGDLEVI